MFGEHPGVCISLLLVHLISPLTRTMAFKFSFQGLTSRIEKKKAAQEPSQNTIAHHEVALFTSLPSEIFEYFIAYLSLGSHAALYQTCRTFRYYYMRLHLDQGIDFFKKACLSLGYNVPVAHPRGKENTTRKQNRIPDYVHLACSLASHARKCDHPACWIVFEDEKIPSHPLRADIPPLYTKEYLKAHPKLEVHFQIPEGIEITHKFKLKYITLPSAPLPGPDSDSKINTAHKTMTTTKTTRLIDHLPIGASLATDADERIAEVTLQIGLHRALINEQGITLVDLLWLMCICMESMEKLNERVSAYHHGPAELSLAQDHHQGGSTVICLDGFERLQGKTSTKPHLKRVIK